MRVLQKLPAFEAELSQDISFPLHDLHLHKGELLGVRIKVRHRFRVVVVLVVQISLLFLTLHEPIEDHDQGSD